MGGVLLGWGLKDAAPFVFFSTREEVAAREQMVSERATGTKLADLKTDRSGFAVLGSLFALVYATGPIGAVGAVLAPLIFWLSLKWLD